MRPPPHIVLSGCKNLGPKRENSKAQPGALFILILTGLGWCGDVVFGQCGKRHELVDSPSPSLSSDRTLGTGYGNPDWVDHIFVLFIFARTVAFLPGSR